MDWLKWILIFVLLFILGIGLAGLVHVISGRELALRRAYDQEHGIICYQADSGSLACVSLRTWQ